MTEQTEYKVVLTISSTDNQEDVGVQITMDPDLKGEDYTSLGFQPSSHQFLERFILPLLESIYMQSNFPELYDDSAAPPSAH